MTAAIEQKNMRSVHVAQMMLKTANENMQESSKKLDLIWASQKGIRKRLNDCDNKDRPLLKKRLAVATKASSVARSLKLSNVDLG